MLPLLATVKSLTSDMRKILFSIVFFIIPAQIFAAQQVEATPQTSDVRVLIDVSGSMKKNDPQNLRLPAMRLLVGLLPPDSTAAVWNFGTKADLIVPPGVTNDEWKTNARKASNQIHSRDLFTNIGTALESAISDWGNSPSKTSQRSIILLTDGMIDIGDNDKRNAEERTRILTKLLPKILATGANIHSIALSKNADHDFLRQLSTKTDGGFEQTDNAKQLERIFLRLFEKTTKRDTVPLVDNQFLVDESILELTLLVFKPENARPTEVIEPDQKTYQLKTRPDYVKWQSEKNYDLLTISRPKAGQWSIKAETDPDNRVMIVTNLQVQTNRIPNNLFAGETLNVSLFMTDNNKKITDDNFLQFISMKAIQDSPTTKRWFLHDNGLRGDEEAHDGIYNVGVRKTLDIGKNEFTFLASSETFQREIKHSVIVHDVELINTRVDQTQKNNTNLHQIFVTPNLEFIQPRNVTMTAQLQDEEQRTQEITFTQANPAQLEWSYESSKLDPEKTYHIIIQMQTQTRSGRPILYTSEPIQLSLPQFDQLILSPESLIKEDVTPIESDENKESDPVIESEVIPEPEESDSGWLMGIIITIITNIILGLAGWFGYKKWKQGRENTYEQIAGEFE
jgi:uncharacterized protein (TIGR03503 family)